MVSQQIQIFQEIYQNRYSIIQEHRERGKKVIGWLCNYVPEEIIYAAGLLPVRLLPGKKDPTVGSAYLYTNICSFARAALEEGLTGRYRLDGLVTSATCDHIRRLYDVWTEYVDTDFNRILSVPSKISRLALEIFEEELSLFKRQLEDFCCLDISQEALTEAINTYNRTRQLLRRLYDLRKTSPPPLTGQEVLWVVLASMVMPKEEFNPLLEGLLTELEEKSSVPNTTDRIRVMIMGSILTQPEYLSIIESTEGLVVIDDLCTGTRYFWDLVSLEDDPLKGLAHRYLTRSPCPRMFPAEARLRRLKTLIHTFMVEGIIYECIKFCDLHGGSFPVIKAELEASGLPVLLLEREYTRAGVGQMKTRVEAFFESIRG